MTIKELEEKLEYCQIPKSWYYLEGYSEGCYGIHFDAGKWIVHTCERGNKYTFEAFSTESEACECLLRELKEQFTVS